jgi:hypothetical protein
MKNNKIIFAALMVVVATAVAFVSCKKENQDAMLNTTQPVKTFTVPLVDDMNAYLKEFKQTMLESQGSKDAEYLSLEEAAWHLSSLANYDFARVNVQYTDLRHDTLYYQVNVTNGQVLLSDLNTVYANMAVDMDAFYQSLDLQEKHFRFIVASISEDGLVMIDMSTSYFILDHTWYFEDDFNAAVACYEWFDGNTYYTWNTTAIQTLESAINYYEGREFLPSGENPTDRAYYVPSRDVLFTYDNNTDTIGSPFYGNSRIYVARLNSMTVPFLEMNEMCYCLDSYLALPFELMQNNPLIGSETPVQWQLLADINYDVASHYYYFFHKVLVRFGSLVENGSSNDY